MNCPICTGQGGANTWRRLTKGIKLFMCDTMADYHAKNCSIMYYLTLRKQFLYFKNTWYNGAIIPLDNPITRRGPAMQAHHQKTSIKKYSH